MSPFIHRYFPYSLVVPGPQDKEAAQYWRFRQEGCDELLQVHWINLIMDVFRVKLCRSLGDE